MHRPFVVIALLALAGASQSTAVTITIQPSPYLPASPQPAALVVSDLKGAVVGGFDLTLTAPAILSGGTPAFGAFLGDPDTETLYYSVPGLRLVQVSLLSEQALAALQGGNSFTLALISYTVAQYGAGSIQISGILSDAAGSPIPVTFLNAPVVAMPEPSPGETVLLAGAVWAVITRLSRSRCHNRR